MHAGVFVISLWFSVVAGSTTCPTLLGGPPSAQPDLKLCVEYAESACCSTYTEAILVTSMDEYKQIYGTDDCWENMRNANCAMVCAPYQAEILTYNPNADTVTGYFDVYYINEVYNSCKQRCADTNVTVGDTWPNGTNWWYHFSVFHATDTQPYVYLLAVDPSSRNETIDLSPALNASVPQDTPSNCSWYSPPPPNTTTTSAGTASATAGMSTTAKESSEASVAVRALFVSGFSAVLLILLLVLNLS